MIQDHNITGREDRLNNGNEKVSFLGWVVARVRVVVSTSGLTLKLGVEASELRIFGKAIAGPNNNKVTGRNGVLPIGDIKTV